MDRGRTHRAGEEPSLKKASPQKPRPTEEEVRGWAYRYLTYRALTAKELTDRLVRKGAPPQIASRVIKGLRAQGLIDERAIVEDTVKVGKEERRESRRAVKYRLLSRGLSLSLIDENLDRQYLPEEEQIIAHQWARDQWKKWIASSQPEDPKGRLRLMRRLASALQRRGFSGETIGTIIREIGQGNYDDYKGNED